MKHDTDAQRTSHYRSNLQLMMLYSTNENRLKRLSSFRLMGH